MSTNICSYQDCMNRRWPCSSIAFFSLPNDSRRSKWIRNSGNKALEHLTSKQARFFCEYHFDPRDIRMQFNRKTLRRHALPRVHKSIKQTEMVKNQNPDKSQLHEDCSQSSTLNSMDTVEIIHSNDEQLHANEDELDFIVDESTTTIEFLNTNDSTADDIISEDDNDDNSLTAITTSIGIQEDQQNIAIDHITHNTNNITSHRQSVDENVKRVETQTLNSGVKLKITPITNNQDIDETTTLSQMHHDEDYASDKHFALSLVHYFQRLEAKKKAMAKIKILTYLTSLEFGENEEL